MVLHLKRQAKADRDRERRERTRAAILLQFRFRVHRGLLGAHLRRRARELVRHRRKRRSTETFVFPNTEIKASIWAERLEEQLGVDLFMRRQQQQQQQQQQWTVCWDDYYEMNYYYNELTGESTWEEPSHF